MYLLAVLYVLVLVLLLRHLDRCMRAAQLRRESLFLSGFLSSRRPVSYAKSVPLRFGEGRAAGRFVREEWRGGVRS